MRPISLVVVLLAVLLGGGRVDAACYKLELKDLRSGEPRPQGDYCADHEIEARRQCRRAAERSNDELPSREPLQYYCRKVD